MTKLRLLIVAGALLASLTDSQAVPGLDWVDSNTNLTFFGDLRLRYEVDWDSHKANGTLRDDRHRGRLRARAGFNYAFSDEWSLGARVRSGNSRSQQSPHLTFVTDDGGRDDLDFVADRYFVQFARERISTWAGRNSLSFWQQTELFWDEDVTPAGLAGTYNSGLGAGKLTASAGAFYLPDGGYDLNGQMLAGQLKYAAPTKIGQWAAAAGLHYINGEKGARNLLNRNGERDYLIGVAGAQWGNRWKDVPITMGADLFYNFKNYRAADVAPFPAAGKDQVLGYVFSMQLGQLKERHDWLLGYYYAHIETFSVNASYAQDDWIRFGSGAQTDASDFEGHELRFGYALSKKINLLARLYVVDAITTGQDGNRFRLDLNWKF